MVHCAGRSLGYNIFNNVAMATLSGGTVAAKRRGKNSYSGQSVSEKKQPLSAKVWNSVTTYLDV